MDLDFKLTIEEVNLILSALSKRPFDEVAGIIFKIKQSADAQVAEKAAEPNEVKNAS